MMFAQPQCESFGQAFLKACGLEGRSPPRAPQSAKSPKRRFSFDNFSFCAYGVKKKSG
jgi:hypothetical protein